MLVFSLEYTNYCMCPILQFLVCLLHKNLEISRWVSKWYYEKAGSFSDTIFVRYIKLQYIYVCGILVVFEIEFCGHFTEGQVQFLLNSTNEHKQYDTYNACTLIILYMYTYICENTCYHFILFLPVCSQDDPFQVRQITVLNLNYVNLDRST